MSAQKQFFEVTECQEGVLIAKKSASSQNRTERAAFLFDFQKTDAVLMEMTRKSAEVLDSTSL